MSVAISWANKMQLAKCDIMVGFPISSHIYTLQRVYSRLGECQTLLCPVRIEPVKCFQIALNFSVLLI